MDSRTILWFPCFAHKLRDIVNWSTLYDTLILMPFSIIISTYRSEARSPAGSNNYNSISHGFTKRYVHFEVVVVDVPSQDYGGGVFMFLKFGRLCVFPC